MNCQRIAIGSMMGCVLFLVVLISTSPAQDSAPDLIGEFVQATEEFRDSQEIPGISVAIATDGELIFQKAHGFSDLENSVPASIETVFRTASIAKPITAMALLRLVEEGKIELDDPIQKYCPEFPETEWPLTIRHLLCHQGGVRHYVSGEEATGKDPFFTIEDSLVHFKDDPLRFEPGTYFLYTTFGYSLLGRAIETASGVSYREFVQQSIFDPADMSTAGLDDWFRIIPNRTRGYMRLRERDHAALPESVRRITTPGQIYNCELHDTSMKVAGGGLLCSPTDLVHFGLALMGERLLTKETLDLAWQIQPTSNGTPTRYGLGWFISDVEGAKVISHSGGQAGTSTFMMMVPEQQTVIAVMCNLEGAPARQLADELSEIVTRSLTASETTR